MPAEEFVRRLKHDARRDDTHYAFWLGAGCSIPSGIPGAGELVSDRWLPLLQEIRGAEERDRVEWASAEFEGYDPENPAAHYGKVMEELFIQPEARQREVEELCENRFPGFGYAVLAALLSHDKGLFNVALTTNFDDLIADAMYVFTEARPLVIPDEALAGYIRPTRMRPLVVKVHGDHRLSPRNTQTETEKLKKGISEGIGNLLHDRGVIFLGYGGNDEGIAELLGGLPSQALPLGVWWASSREPQGELCDWLHDRAAIWVESRGFEELMLLFKDEFDVPRPNEKKFENLFQGYLDTFNTLRRRVGQMAEDDPEASPLKDAATRSEAPAKLWSDFLFQATQLEDTEPKKAEHLFREGVEEYPHSVSLGLGYAAFLINSGRFERAEKIVDKVLRQSPGDERAVYYKAHLLVVKGALDEGVAAYRGWVKLEPESIQARGLYGIVLVKVGKIEEARGELEKMLSMQPATPRELSVAALLFEELGDLERAAAYWERFVPNSNDGNDHANFARCLISRAYPEEARREIEEAQNLLPPNAGPTRLEVSFYKFVIGDEAEADEALEMIHDLISDGIRSPSWMLDRVVEFGKDSGHPDAEWLPVLAQLINNIAEPDALDSWKHWSDTA